MELASYELAALRHGEAAEGESLPAPGDSDDELLDAGWWSPAQHSLSEGGLVAASPPGAGGEAVPAEGACAQTAPASNRSKPRRSYKAIAFCQIDGCGVSLVGEKGYFRRYNICSAHFKAPACMLKGRAMRFCQQCNKLQDVADFEANRRSCLARIDPRQRPSSLTSLVAKARSLTRPAGKGKAKAKAADATDVDANADTAQPTAPKAKKQRMAAGQAAKAESKAPARSKASLEASPSTPSQARSCEASQLQQQGRQEPAASSHLVVHHLAQRQAHTGLPEVPEATGPWCDDEAGCSHLHQHQHQHQHQQQQQQHHSSPSFAISRLQKCGAAWGPDDAGGSPPSGPEREGSWPPHQLPPQPQPQQPGSALSGARSKLKRERAEDEPSPCKTNSSSGTAPAPAAAGGIVPATPPPMGPIMRALFERQQQQLLVQHEAVQPQPQPQQSGQSLPGASRAQLELPRLVLQLPQEQDGQEQQQLDGDGLGLPHLHMHYGTPRPSLLGDLPLSPVHACSPEDWLPEELRRRSSWGSGDAHAAAASDGQFSLPPRLRQPSWAAGRMPTSASMPSLSACQGGGFGPGPEPGFGPADAAAAAAGGPWAAAPAPGRFCSGAAVEQQGPGAPPYGADGAIMADDPAMHDGPYALDAQRSGAARPRAVLAGGWGPGEAPPQPYPQPAGPPPPHHVNYIPPGYAVRRLTPAQHAMLMRRRQTLAIMRAQEQHRRQQQQQQQHMLAMRHGMPPQQQHQAYPGPHPGQHPRPYPHPHHQQHYTQDGPCPEGDAYGDAYVGLAPPMAPPPHRTSGPGYGPRGPFPAGEACPPAYYPPAYPHRQARAHPYYPYPPPYDYERAPPPMHHGPPAAGGARHWHHRAQVPLPPLPRMHGSAPAMMGAFPDEQELELDLQLGREQEEVEQQLRLEEEEQEGQMAPAMMMMMPGHVDGGMQPWQGHARERHGARQEGTAAAFVSISSASSGGGGGGGSGATPHCFTGGYGGPAAHADSSSGFGSGGGGGSGVPGDASVGLRRSGGATSTSRRGSTLALPQLDYCEPTAGAGLQVGGPAPGGLGMGMPAWASGSSGASADSYTTARWQQQQQEVRHDGGAAQHQHQEQLQQQGNCWVEEGDGQMLLM